MILLPEGFEGLELTILVIKGLKPMEIAEGVKGTLCLQKIACSPSLVYEAHKMNPFPYHAKIRAATKDIAKVAKKPKSVTTVSFERWAINRKTQKYQNFNSVAFEGVTGVSFHYDFAKPGSDGTTDIGFSFSAPGGKTKIAFFSITPEGAVSPEKA